MLRLIGTLALACAVSTPAAAGGTCGDMRRAFDGGDNARGLALVREATLAAYASRIAKLDINRVTPAGANNLTVTIMFVCKNGLAGSLDEAGELAGVLISRRNQ